MAYLRIFAALLCCGLVCATSASLEPFYVGRRMDVLPRESGIRATRGDADFEFFQEQHVNHFDPADDRRFSHRFVSRTDRLRPAGTAPQLLLVLMGAEGPVDTADLQAPRRVAALLDQFGGAALSIEHRFFGASRPLGDDFSFAALGLLSPEQALADHVRLIEWWVAREGYSRDDFVIVAYGGSYGGDLAAWARSAYPHFFAAAVAHSAPVQAKADFPEYLQKVQETLNRHSADRACGDTVAAAVRAARDVLTNDFSEFSIGVSRFVLAVCLDLLSDDDLPAPDDSLGVDNFMHNLLFFMTVVERSNSSEIADFCEPFEAALVDKPSSTPLDILLASYREHGGAVPPPTSMADSLAPFSVDTLPAELADVANTRAWLWLSCTQLGWFRTAASPLVMHGAGVHYSYYTNVCQTVFNTQRSLPSARQISYSNMVFGGAAPMAHAVLHIHGENDPWSTLRAADGRLAQIVTVQDVGHCAAMVHTEAPSDSLRAAFEAEEALIRGAIENASK